MYTHSFSLLIPFQASDRQQKHEISEIANAQPGGSRERENTVLSIVQFSGRIAYSKEKPLTQCLISNLRSWSKSSFCECVLTVFGHSEGSQKGLRRFSAGSKKGQKMSEKSKRKSCLHSSSNRNE